METQVISLTQYHHTHWRKKTQLLNCSIWENSQNNSIAEGYIVYNYDRTHAKINRNKKFIVNVLAAIYHKANNTTYLLIQRIPSRLSQIHSLTEAQTMKILYGIFKGLEELQQVYGLVRLSESCICFNQHGHVKIWVNPDLSCLQPAFPFRDNSNNNKKIIQIIFQIFETLTKKCFNKSFIGGVLNKLLSNKIKDLHQVSDSIIKIGELHFIDVHYEKIRDKLIPGQLTQSIENMREVPKQVRSQRNSRRGHNRKFSYQSWMEQRQLHNEPMLKKQPVCFGRGVTSYPPEANNKKRKQQSVERNNCEEITCCSGQDMDQRIGLQAYEDSFSRHLGYEDKQIVVSGQFQTFGVLQDSEIESQKFMNKREELEKKKISRKSSFAEINEQMQRLLSNEEEQKENSSWLKQCLSIDREKIKRFGSKISSSRKNSNFMKKYQENGYFESAEGQSSTSSVNKIRALRYLDSNNIDRTFEQYLKTKGKAHLNMNFEQRKQSRVSDNKPRVPRVPSFLQGERSRLQKMKGSNSNQLLSEAPQLNNDDLPARYYPLTQR